MRIGGDDPDERSKHSETAGPDTTAAITTVSAAKTTATITVSAAIAKTAITKGSKTAAISSRTRTTGEARCAKTGTSTSAPRQKQRVRMQDDSPTVDDGRGKRPRVVASGSQKMEPDQVPESDLPPVPEVDDLNATVIEVMTDVEVLLDGSSVIDVFAVISARRKRVEVRERKLTESASILA